MGSDPPRPLAAGQASPSAEFPTTHWTLVMRVRAEGPARQLALEELCRLYWYPIYAFLRRRGYAQHDAEDLTQGLFIKLLRDETFESAEETKGRLRTFLLWTLTRHLADQHRRQEAQKRGGGQQTIAFEDLHAEERYQVEPQDLRDPEQIFMQAWARTVIEGVRNKLHQQFIETGREGVFETLLPFLLMEEAPPSYREVARKLDSSETAVRLLVFRMRARFRGLVEEEVGQTVNGPEELASELAWLRSVLTR